MIKPQADDNIVVWWTNMVMVAWTMDNSTNLYLKDSVYEHEDERLSHGPDKMVKTKCWSLEK